MKKTLRILGYFLLVLVLAAFLAGAAGWWVGYRALPELDGTASLPELKQEATVDRDGWGVPRIRASSLEDLLTAQGYVVAQDRLWQMDLLRRAAAGELSEIFGAVTLGLDRENRILGLKQAADAGVARMDPQRRALLEAYARGVNRYITERRGRLPWEFVALRYEPRPWTPSDSLLVGAYMFSILTTTWEWELSRAKTTARLGPDRARELFTVDSPGDHIIVGAEAQATGRTATPLGIHDPHSVLAHFRQDVE
ncbi:MAG TPA: penicillin acylase family protein, partial [Candidatus Acidoferrales bacterium]